MIPIVLVTVSVPATVVHHGIFGTFGVRFRLILCCEVIGLHGFFCVDAAIRIFPRSVLIILVLLAPSLGRGLTAIDLRMLGLIRVAIRRVWIVVCFILIQKEISH